MRNRAMTLVLRDGKLLVEKVFYEGRSFYTLPGGGIEPGETPEQAAIRELREECGVDGRIVRKLTVLYGADGRAEHVFLTAISDDQAPILGCDPEFAPDAQAIKSVCWVALDEMCEKDRAFMWSYGLITVPGFYEEVIRWGDELSYPGKI